MRDGEGEDLPMKLHLTTNEPIELDDSSHRKRHAVGVLSVRDIERCSTALHLASKEREVHVVRGHEVRLIAGDKVANEWGELVELRFGERLPLESHREIRLWTRSCQG